MMPYLAHAGKHLAPETRLMNPMRACIPALVLVLLMAGCLTGGGDEEPLEAGAVATDDTGGIEGTVTNPAIEAIPDATVHLVEIDETTQTAMDGGFAISQIPPGEYTLRIEADGYIGTERVVTIHAALVETVDIVLSQEADETPYQHTIDMVGFVECGIGWRQDAASIGQPLAEDSAYAACATPNIYTEGNATNDRFMHTFTLDPTLTEVIYEMGWDEGSTDATSPALRSIMELDGFINVADARIMDTRGPNPIHVHLTEEHWERLETNITTNCEEAESDGSDWCSLNPRTNGFNMVQRVFATGDCYDTIASACAVLQQEFTHYITAFYHQRAPSDYRILDA